MAPPPAHMASTRSRRPHRRTVGVLAAVGLLLGAIGISVWLGLGGGQAGNDTAAAATTLPGSGDPTSTSEATTTTAPPRQARLVFGGDVLIHQGIWRAAQVDGGYDFSPLLAPVADQLSAADLALCHLEVTLTSDQAPTGYPRFRAPAALATDLAEAGFDGCSVASNHSLDYGADGVTATLAALDGAGLGHAGTARSAEEDSTPARYDVAGIAVAHLSYSYGFNGFVEPAATPWLVDQIDPAQILADAAAARTGGAELVVVSLHWGNEYAHGVTTAQQEVADALAASPGAVDLIVGHHAHVVQPVSKVGDMWVIWGLGNMLSNNTPGCCSKEVVDGVLVTASIADRADRSGVEVTGIEFTPLWNERHGHLVLPAARTLAAGDVAPALAADLRGSFERTAGHILALGGAELGVTPTEPLPQEPSG